MFISGLLLPRRKARARHCPGWTFSRSSLRRLGKSLHGSGRGLDLLAFKSLDPIATRRVLRFLWLHRHRGTDRDQVNVHA